MAACVLAPFFGPKVLTCKLTACDDKLLHDDEPVFNAVVFSYLAYFNFLRAQHVHFGTTPFFSNFYQVTGKYALFCSFHVYNKTTFMYYLHLHTFFTGYRTDLCPVLHYVPPAENYFGNTFRYLCIYLSDYLICFLCLNSVKSKGGRSNGRKTKSPGLSGGERPSSVSSVHSEGDCNRHTPLTNRVWEDRPSSTGTHTQNHSMGEISN